MNNENKSIIKAINMFGRVPEQWELLEEIERLNNIIEKNKYSADELNEIERLNNIINELERYINEEYIYDELGMKIFDASTLQDKLQELKGSDKE